MLGNESMKFDRQNYAPLPPKDVHILISRTCEQVGLHGKTELKLQMGSRFLISLPSDKGTMLVVFLVGTGKSQASLYREAKERIKEVKGSEEIGLMLLV